MGQINTTNYPTVSSLADADLLIVENATHGTGTTTPKQLRENAIGTDPLQTTAQTVTGAINELKNTINTQMIKTEYTLSYNSWETGTGDYLGYYIYEIETNPRLNGDYPVNVYLSSGQASDFMPTAEEVEAFNDSIVGGDMFSSDMGDYTKITLIAWQRPVDRSQMPKNLKVFIEGVKY